ncbi:ribosome biogenesis GTPase Der [Candidatus Parcubacteria bacterium]|nr:ribosome biogenesis GTPase Der [Candidatus Parcubacteria bacterium]
MNSNNLPLVVIFGRTNVGKSTLFNCLIEKHQALTSDIAGTTRDANWATIEWCRNKFSLVDTGGIMDLKFLAEKKLQTTDIEAKVQEQARNLLKRADLILFLTDARDGLLPTDKELVKFLMKTKNKNKILLVANKADNPRLRQGTAEFNKLGLGEPLAISAANGSGTGDLLDEITNKLPESKKPVPSPLEGEGKGEVIKVAIIGKPNVGKSSLVNSLLGEERIIVSPTAHTTREPQDIEIKYKKNHFVLIDTAGISKKGRQTAKRTKNKNTLEKFSILKSLAVIRKADVALLVIDINKGLTQQESKLVEDIIKKQTSLIIIANKWDLIEDKNTKHYTREINIALPFATWAPIQFVSALTGAKTEKVLDLAAEIYQARHITIKENSLNKFLNKIVKIHRPTKAKGIKRPRIYELAQVQTNPPVFKVRISQKDTLNESYLRFIENQLRKKYGFLGTPINIYVERNKSVHGKNEDLKMTNSKTK